MFTLSIRYPPSFGPTALLSIEAVDMILFAVAFSSSYNILNISDGIKGLQRLATLSRHAYTIETKVKLGAIGNKNQKGTVDNNAPDIVFKVPKRLATLGATAFPAA